MKKYVLGLKMGKHIQYVMEIGAENLREAKETWAWLTCHCDPMWDVERQTYSGWEVIETKLPTLQRKDCKPSRWQY